MVFVLCISLLMPYIRIKFRKNILKDSELWCGHNFQFEIYKGAYFPKLWFLFSAHRLIMFHICTKFTENNFYGLNIMKLIRFQYSNYTVFFLCTYCNDALSMYQVS